MTKIKNWFLNHFYPEKDRNPKSPLYILVAVVAIAAMVVANILAVKQFSLFGWNINGESLSMPCAVILFPVTYIVSDLISEVYGFSTSRRIAWYSFLINLITVGFFELAIVLPGNDVATAEAFKIVLGATPLTLAASLVAWLVGSLVNDIVFQKMKEKGSQKGFSYAIRAIVSSECGEITDSLIFMPILYVNLCYVLKLFPYPSIWTILAICVIQATIKVLYEVLIAPLNVVLTKKAKGYEEKFNEQFN